MKTATRYLTSTIAVFAAFVAVNIIYLAQSTCNDCVIHYGLPFTFYEQGSGWGFAVQRFVWAGAIADALILVLAVVIVALGWNRTPRMLSVAFALLAVFCGVCAGVGAALLFTHTYTALPYSLSFTAACVAASVLFFRAAKMRGCWIGYGKPCSRQQSSNPS